MSKTFDERDYPSNSKHRKYNKDPNCKKPKLEKVVDGKVVTRKKSLGRKFLDTFKSEDSGNVIEYIVHTIFIPTMQNLLVNSIQDAIEMMVYGERGRSPNIRRNGGRSHYDYVKCSHKSSRESEYDRRLTRSQRARHNFDDVIFESRREAESVLDFLGEHLYEYNDVTVADFYDLAGLESTYSDRDWGWTDLKSAYVEHVRDGWIVRFPRTISLI